MIHPRTSFQFFKFAAVGIASNLVIYLLYLFFTFYGMGPKLTMSGLYALGVAQTFWANRKWTFRFTGDGRPAQIRYCVSYAFGYVLNLVSLLIFVDWLQYPHQVVQGILILLLAGILFLLQKFWVFHDENISHSI